MVSMDTLILQIMNQAQKLVNADRASLFLVDSKTGQLYARIFDVAGGNVAAVTQARAEVRSAQIFFIKILKYFYIFILQRQSEVCQV